jgi:hypothetical protein
VITVNAKGGETIHIAASRAIAVSEVADDSVELIFNGIKLRAFKDPAKSLVFLYEVLTDFRNERKIKLPDYLEDKK